MGKDEFNIKQNKAGIPLLISDKKKNIFLAEKISKK